MIISKCFGPEIQIIELGAEQAGMIYCGRQQGMKFSTVWQLEIGKPSQSRNAKLWLLMIIITCLQLQTVVMKEIPRGKIIAFNFSNKYFLSVKVSIHIHTCEYTYI